MTVLEAIQRGAEFLAQKGIDSPRLQAELLLAHALGLPRLQLYLQFGRELLPDETTRARELIRDRARHVPLQHLVGSASFCGLEIRVTDHALTPRPETETLAEAGWEFLGRSAGDGCPRALEIGAGSGCLAIALAAHAPRAQVIATDISRAALELARENMRTHELTARVSLVEADLFEPFRPGRWADLIISNPPYIPTSEIESLAPEVREHDPRLALDGGPDGLRFYRVFAGAAAQFLRPGGKLMLEIGDGQEEALSRLFSEQGWRVEWRQDLTNRPRVLMASATGAER